MSARLRVRLIAATALVGGLLPSIADAPEVPTATLITPAVTTAEAVRIDWPVRIDEQIVRIEAAAPAGERLPARRRTVRHRYARDNADSVMSRARRWFFGDGEARPEPFPRPR